MTGFNRILVPIDFSEHSTNALRYACALSETFSAELHLLHVLQDLIAMIPEPGLSFPAPGNYMEEMKTSAEEQLQKLPRATPLSETDGGKTDGAATDESGTKTAAEMTVVRDIRQGPPFLEIVRYAKEKECDLIVVGTHGRSGLAHMLLGSVAGKVVRKASCPVLTVRLDQHPFELP